MIENAAIHHTSTVAIYNNTDKTLPSALLSLLKRSMARTYSIVLSLHSAPKRATAGGAGNGPAVVIEVYEDGSGLEVTAVGFVLILGIEDKGRLRPLRSPTN